MRDSTHSESTRSRPAEEKVAHSTLNLLQVVLNTIDEPIYIVDLVNDEIIFANKKIDELFGDVIGARCWETLQKGQDGPCHFCTNHYLVDKNSRPTGVYRSRYKNNLTESWYQCCDKAFKWTNGRMVAIKTSVDVTAIVESNLSVKKLFEQNRSLTQKALNLRDKERKQLSLDLHDELGQIGTAIKLNAEFLLAQEKVKTTEENNALKDIVSLTSDFLKTTHNISNRLNPQTLISNLTISELLSELFEEWLLRNRKIKGGISFNIDHCLDSCLGTNHKEILFRTLQEALTNISRHSKATQVTVSCNASKRDMDKVGSPKGATYIFKMKISDDGVGFPESTDSRNLGLTYMNERITSQRGNLSTGRSIMGGAEVLMQLPCTIQKGHIKNNG